MTINTGSGDDQIYIQANSSAVRTDSSGGNDGVFLGLGGSMAGIGDRLSLKENKEGALIRHVEYSRLA